VANPDVWGQSGLMEGLKTTGRTVLEFIQWLILWKPWLILRF
jgi:hypothetical protein